MVGIALGEFRAPALLLWLECSDYNTVKTYIRREEQLQERGKLNAALRGLYIKFLGFVGFLLSPLPPN